MAISWRFRRWFSEGARAARRGRAAERGARRFLERRGLELIARNFRCRAGEIDLVMRDGATIVFVEVRLRSRTEWGSAADSIGAAKRARLVRAARTYLASRPACSEAPCRFDAVTVTRPHYRLRYEWIRDAFAP
jgi:putative endonuclease